MSFLYVYGLTRPGLDLRIETAAVVGAAVRTLPLPGFDALISEIDTPEIKQTRRNMLAHTRVLEEALKFGPVLPTRFGLIAESAEQIAAAVESQRPKLAELLTRLDGKVEMGVRINFDRAAIMREIAAENPAIAARIAQLRKLPEAATHFERIDLGQAIAQLLANKRSAEETALFAQLAPVAEDRLLQAPDDDIQALKADCLICASAEAQFTAFVEALAQKGEGRWNVRLIGPAPPFNYVRVRLSFAPRAEAA